MGKRNRRRNRKKRSRSSRRRKRLLKVVKKVRRPSNIDRTTDVNCEKIESKNKCRTKGNNCYWEYKKEKCKDIEDIKNNDENKEEVEIRRPRKERRRSKERKERKRSKERRRSKDRETKDKRISVKMRMQGIDSCKRYGIEDNRIIKLYCFLMKKKVDGEEKTKNYYLRSKNFDKEHIFRGKVYKHKKHAKRNLKRHKRSRKLKKKRLRNRN